MKSLHEYLNQVMREKPLQQNFNRIRQSAEFKAFKDIFLKTKHTGLTSVQTEEFFLQTFEKIEASWMVNVDNVAKNVLAKSNEIQMDIMKRL